MLCELAASDGICDNCGQRYVAGRKCSAEARTVDVFAMRDGEIPLQCIELTPHQQRRLANVTIAAALTESERRELFPTLSDDTLIGNRLELLFKEFGLPPCRGCAARRDYLNKLHAMARSVWGLA
jgi:hypothetical protein